MFLVILGYYEVLNTSAEIETSVISSPSNKVLYFTSSKGHPRKKRVVLFWRTQQTPLQFHLESCHHD